MNPIYDTTIFKKLFEVNDPTVLGWALNVLEKLYQRGLLPDYVDRNREDKDDSDFIVYWNSITHLFALLVYFARNFENIAANKTILIEYLNNFDLKVPFDQNLEDLGYIYSNRPDEYRRRGTSRITYPKGVNDEGVDGELLRALNKQELDFFLFALIEASEFGWCIGESSPTWTGTENITNLTLAYEFTKEVVDLDLYPLYTPVDISIVTDPTISLDVMNINPGASVLFAGIGDEDVNNPDRDKLILIDPGIDYEISLKVKKDIDDDDDISFGAYSYDENYSLETLLPISTNKSNPNNFQSQIVLKTLLVENEYYWLRGVLYAFNTPDSDTLKLNFPEGRGLVLNQTSKFISPYFLTSSTSIILDVYDFKMRPLDLPISQGFFGVKNIIAGYLKNNGELSDEDLRLFIQNKLIPYNSFLIPKYL
jgi:hypothetical protein